MLIRSYRRVFRINRRLYRIERWTIPVPGGIPLIGIGYFAAALIVVLICGQLPLAGSVVGLLPPPLRYVILPAALATLLVSIEPDGRAPHRYVIARLRLTLRPRTTRAAGSVARPRVTTLRTRLMLQADAHGGQLERALIHGPCEIAFAQLVRVRVPGPVRRRLGRHRLVARPLRGAERHSGELVADRLALAAGERAEVRP